MKRNSERYSLLKVAEGGSLTKKDALAELSRAGIQARSADTPYIGHYGIEVIGGQRDQRRAARILFS